MNTDWIWERAQELSLEYHDIELEYLVENLRQNMIAMAERDYNEMKNRQWDGELGGVMVKVETITFEYEHCGECPNADYSPTKKNPFRHKCFKTKRAIPDIWGKFPNWCPLESKGAL